MYVGNNKSGLIYSIGYSAEATPKYGVIDILVIVLTESVSYLVSESIISSVRGSIEHGEAIAKIISAGNTS